MYSQHSKDGIKCFFSVFKFKLCDSLVLILLTWEVEKLF